MANETQDFNEQIKTVTQNIFEAMVGLPVMHVTEPNLNSSSINGFYGEIRISGTWNGSVKIYFENDLANRTVTSMLSRDISKISNSEKLDVLREVLNMIGGNMKSMLPGPSRLSIPIVVEDKVHPINEASLQSNHWLGFQFENSALWVNLSAEGAA